MPRFDKEYQGYLRGECKNYNQPLINALEEMEKGGAMVLVKRDENDYRIAIWSERFKRHMWRRLVWHRWHEVAYEEVVKLINAMEGGRTDEIRRRSV